MASTSDAGRGAGAEGRQLRIGGQDGPHIIEDGPHISEDGGKIVQGGAKRWSEEAEELFLDCLAASANVRRACRAAGFSKVAIYRRRANDPVFARRWQKALAQAYARIELALVRRAEAALTGKAGDPDTPIPQMSVSEALTLLKHHHVSVHGGEGRRPYWPARPRSLDEVGKSILRKMDAIEAMPDEAMPDEAGDEAG